MDLVPDSKFMEYAEYADKHGIHDLFQQMLEKLLVARPLDPFQFMINFLSSSPRNAYWVISPPCSGAGDLAPKVAMALDVVFISIDELIDANIAKQTASAVQAKAIIERGEQLPDELVRDFLVERLEENDVAERGYLLEGFPKTKVQAMVLIASGIVPTKVFEFDVSDQVILARSSGIRFDQITSKTYHLEENPPPQNVFILKRLLSRPEDSGELLQQRLKLYRHEAKLIVQLLADNHRLFTFANGIFKDSTALMEVILKFAQAAPKSRGPRLFKLLIAGYPGSGADKLAELFQDKYNYVHVSPRLAITSELYSGNENAKEAAKYLDDLDSCPSSVIGPLIVNRLSKSDCRDHGWILEGFPKNAAEAEYLKNQGIMPTRVIWLDAAKEKCCQRIRDRRFHPQTGAEVSVNDISEFDVDAGSYYADPKDQSEKFIAARFEHYTKTKKELCDFYRPKTSPDDTGIWYSVEEDEEGGVESLIQRAEASLLRAIPISK